MMTVLGDLHRYPDGSGYYLVKALSSSLGFDPECIVLGNGSNEIIEFLVKAFVQPMDEVITSHPSFLMYQKFVQVRGGINHVLELKDMEHDLEGILNRVTEKTRLVFLDNPNNPCGTVITPDALDSFLGRMPDHVIVVLDEAYIDFADDEFKVDVHSLITDCKNSCGVVSMRTFSKAYGLAGLRIGFGLMPPEIAACLHKVRQPFNLNKMALAGAEAALADDGFYKKTISKTREGKKYLMDGVNRLGCSSYPSQTNFFLIDVKGDATVLYESMLKKGVIVRSMKAYGFPGFIRINVGTDSENDRFLTTLEESLAECGYV